MSSFVEVADGFGAFAGYGTGNWSTGVRTYPGHYNNDSLTDIFVHRDVGNPPSGQWWIRLGSGVPSFTCPTGQVCNGTFEGGFAVHPGFFDTENANSTRYEDIFVYRSATGTGRVYRSTGNGTLCCTDESGFGTTGIVTPGFENADVLTDLVIRVEPESGPDTWRVRNRTSANGWSCSTCNGTWTPSMDIYTGYLEGF